MYIIATQLRWLTARDAEYFDLLLPSLVILKPLCFPQILVYTSHPTASMLQVNLQRHIKTPTRPLSDAPLGMVLQVSAMAQRILLYGVTGQEKVLSKKAGNCLAVTPHLTDGGLPYFAGTVILVGARAPYIDPINWPTVQESPLLISGPTVRYHFGALCAEVST